MTDMHAPMRSRGRGLQFGLFGIPVRIGLSFPLILAFLALQLEDLTLIVVFVVVGGASVLLHEMGHAVVARLAGHRPTVQLAGMGGLTSYRGETSRGWQLAITASGPFIQVLAGLVGLYFLDGFRLVVQGTIGQFALSAWVFVSLVWGVLNLVPMLPLDGGQLFRDLLPGSLRTRTMVAHVVSIVIAVAALGWALTRNDTWIVLLAGYFGYGNVMGIVGLRQQAASGAESEQAEPGAAELLSEGHQRLNAGDASGWALAHRAVQAPGPKSVQSVAASTVVTGLLQAGRDREAYLAVADRRNHLSIDEVVMARALATHPNRVGVRQVVLGWAHARDDARSRGIAALLMALGGDLAVAHQWVDAGPVSPAVRDAVTALTDLPQTPS